MVAIAYAVLPGPWGPIHVAADEAGLVALDILTPTSVFEASISRRWHVVPRPLDGETPLPVRHHLEAAIDGVAGYFAGRPGSFASLPIDLGPGAAWDRRVLEGVRGIPYGHVTSYGRVARIAGSPGAARAVGGAVGRNPIGLVIPCHRGDRERLLAIKRELLAREGVVLPASELLG